MTTLSKTDFVNRNANNSIDLAKTKETLTAAQQRALVRADANHDGKIEGTAELRQAFKNADDFDKNGSRSSVNVGTQARPTSVGTMFKNIEKAATPRRGLGSNNGGSGADGVSGTTPAPAGNGRDGVANITRTTHAGARNQLVEGQVTVNGHTYNFRSGGHGRGSLPKGDYQVTRHMDSRNSPGMVVDGVGYSFAMSDKFDSRVGGTRSLLRIHPDGGSAGTNGCIGIVGDGATQRRFREDMLAEIRRNGGSYTLRVQ